MKNNRNLFLIATLAIFMLTSCSTETEKPTVETSEAEQAVVTEETSEATAIPLNTGESSLTWNGYKAIVDTAHEGTLNIAGGNFLIEDNELVGGSFTLDMTTIENNDLDGGRKEGLENHLNSEEFFNTADFQEGSFEVTQVTPIQETGATHQISGNLTLKEISKNITFKANLEGLDTEEITSTADFNINRQDWNLGHSDDQSIIEQMQDNALQNEIRIRLNLQS